MPRAQQCPACGGAVADAVLCKECGQLLAESLDQVAWLVGELDVLLTRQSRTGERTISRSATAPLPFDVRASQASTHLHASLARWATELNVCRSGRAVDLAAGLAGSIDRIRQLEQAGKAHAELLGAIGRAERVIDLQPERWYAGACDRCDEDVYALPGAGWVHCRCGWQADAAERRRWLLNAAEDTLAHSALIAQALSRLGQPVTGAMIRGYAFRGRIVAHGTDRLGRPLYRIGDLLDILSSDAARSSERASHA